MNLTFETVHIDGSSFFRGLNFVCSFRCGLRNRPCHAELFDNPTTEQFV